MMVMLKNRLHRCSAGVFFGCLVCFLMAGCGGKGDSPEQGKPTQEIVRQKIPTAEQIPEPAKTKKQKKAPQTDQAPTSSQLPVEKATPPDKGTPPVQTETKQETAPAATESAAVPSAQPETVTGETPKDLSDEKKAEIDAITKDAEKAAKVAAVNEPADNAVQARHKTSPKGETAGLTEESTEKTDEAPVIDLAIKEKGERENAEEQAEDVSAENELFNPFAPLFQKEDSGVAVTELPSFRERREFLTPLEKIDIGQLTLKGIIQAQSGNRAIVIDASGEGYVIRKGTYVGLNSGTVEKIESDRVVIVESIGARQSQTVLKLQKPAGE